MRYERRRSGQRLGVHPDAGACRGDPGDAASGLSLEPSVNSVSWSVAQDEGVPDPVLLDAVPAFKVGDPAEPRVASGPMVTEKQHNRAQSYIRKGLETEEEAIEIADNSTCGLAAYVTTTNPEHGEEIADQLEAGGVMVNGLFDYYDHPDASIGGFKMSGFGREFGIEGIEGYLETQSVFAR